MPGRVRKSPKSKPTSSDLPTEQSWVKMIHFNSFVITNKEDGTEHKFSMNDCTTILPHNQDPESSPELWNYWVGKIVDIRAEIDDEGTNTVWAKVQWFYNSRDTSGVIKSFNTDAVTPFERIFANHYDFVESHAFEAVVRVPLLDENSVEPPFISRDEFFQRYTLEYKTRMLKPKPGSRSCICERPYSPDDPLVESLMHFCPRPSCRRGYHQSCLLAGKFKESSSISTKSKSSVVLSSQPSSSRRSARKHASPVKRPRPTTKSETAEVTLSSRSLRLLACSPDTDDNVDLESLVALTIVQVPEGNPDSARASENPPTKIRRGRSSKNTTAATLDTEVVTRSLPDVLTDFPPLLLQVAQQPMVRGKAFQRGGVSGNIGFVTRARRLVYQLLEGCSLPDDWEHQVFGTHNEENLGADNAIIKLVGTKKALPHVICPTCKSAI